MSNNPFELVAAETKAVTSSVRSPGVPATALYEGVIKAAYLIESPWNKVGEPVKIDLALHIELPSGYEHKIQKTVLIDGSPKAKNREGKMALLFTYVTMTHIVGAALDGKTLVEAFNSIQVKPIKLWNFEKKQEVLTDVKMIDDLVGRELLIGLQRKISNKRQFLDGEWMDQPERKETLEFGVAASKADRRTYVEMVAGTSAEDAVEADKWEKQNSGKDWDAYKNVASAAAGLPAGIGAGNAAAAGAIDFGAS
jgi:hypothetical protein